MDGVKDPLYARSTEHGSSALTLDAGTQACPEPASTSARPSSTLATQILSKLDELNKNLLVVNARLAAAEDHSSGMAATKQTRPARRKRKLSIETLANNRKYDDRRSTGTARSGPMPASLNCTGFVSYKKLKALVRRTTALEVLTQLGYPVDLLVTLSNTQLLDMYAIIFLMMWSHRGVAGIDSNLDSIYFQMDPTPQQNDQLLAWACPALFNWLASLPAASRKEFHQPSQDKLKHHDLSMIAVKGAPAPTKKVKTSADILPSTSGPRPTGTGI